ncbi:metallophosphoesterase, partial [Bacillus thuringiensis]
AGRPEDDGTKKRRSEELIRAQYRDINNYMNSLPSNVNGNVIINGDMTAFGHGTEWSKINNLIQTLNRPYYYGLGNHDIENNFSNCYNNGCFKNSLQNLIQHVRSRPVPISFDYNVSGPYSWGYREHKGSFAYTLNLGAICFIQLQHNPTMNKTADPEFWASLNDKYTIVPNFNWVENQLRMARDNGKIIIVNVHVKGNISGDYTRLLQNYGVTAVFSGHFHTSLGTNGSVGNIPAFISGSASQSTYLILEQYTDRLAIYTVRNNNWKARQLVGTIPISTQLPIFSGRYKIITNLNNNSVVDMNPNNFNVHLWEDRNQLNAQWDFNYNQSAQAYVIRNASNSNRVLAWNAPNPAIDRNVFATPLVSGYDEHLWIIERGSNGLIFRNRKNPNLVLDVQDEHTANGTNIKVHQLHPATSGSRRAQEFHLRKMN